MHRKRWFWVVVALVLSALIGKQFLLDTAAAANANFVIDTDALHRVATASGSLPESIEVEKVGDFAFPGKLVLAGDSFKMHPMVLLAHRVIWPNHSLLIDTAMPPSATQKMPGSKADPAAYARVVKAMHAASTILFTHEHEDHVGGLAALADGASLSKQVRITGEQLDSPRLERNEFSKGLLEALTPLEYDGLYLVAPGVVVQKAPGHSPGSQLIYVELANGKRFLFVGDIAWSKENVKRQTGRPGLAAVLLKEDRAAVASQLKALAALPADIHLIIAHDPVALKEDLDHGLYRLGFSGL